MYRIVSLVSGHGCLNKFRNFGPHGYLPGIKIPYACIKAATVAFEITREWHLPGTLRYNLMLKKWIYQPELDGGHRAITCMACNFKLCSSRIKSFFLFGELGKLLDAPWPP